MEYHAHGYAIRPFKLPPVLQKVGRYIAEAIEIPRMLLKTEDPDSAMNWRRYHNKSVPNYDDWKWFWDSAPRRRDWRASARVESEAVLAQKSVRKLHDYERAALFNATTQRYDPNENRRRNWNKFLKESRRYQRRMRHALRCALRYAKNRKYVGHHTRRSHRYGRKVFFSPQMSPVTSPTESDPPSSVRRNASSHDEEYGDDPEAGPSGVPSWQTLQSREEYGDDPEAGPSGVPSWQTLQSREDQFDAAQIPVMFSSSSDSSGIKAAPAKAEVFEETPVADKSWWPRCTFFTPLQQWKERSCSHNSENSNGSDWKTGSSTLPDDPYQNVFVIEGDTNVKPSLGHIVREREFHLIQPYGDKKPVLVYRAEVKNVIEMQLLMPTYPLSRAELTHPPCFCRPGFPMEGECNTASKNRLIPKMTWTEQTSYLVAFFLRTALLFGLAIYIMVWFLKVHGYTNVQHEPVKVQEEKNTFIDLEETTTGQHCKVYLFKGKQESKSLEVEIEGPFELSSSEPYFEYQMERLYSNKSDLNPTNVKIANDIISETLSAEVQHTSRSKQYTSSNTCPADSYLKQAVITATKPNIYGSVYELDPMNFTRSIKCIWYSFIRNCTSNIYDPNTGVLTTVFTSATRNMIISDYAIYWNNEQGTVKIKYKENAQDITMKWTNVVDTQALNCKVKNPKCYHTYSVKLMYFEPMRTSNINWASHINFWQTGIKLKIQQTFDNWKGVPGNVILEHALYANLTKGDDRNKVKVIYSFRYCIKETTRATNPIVMSRLKRSVPLTFKYIRGHDNRYTTTSTTPAPPKTPLTMFNKVKTNVMIALAFLYILLILQTDRAIAVIFTAAAVFCCLTNLQLKPAAKQIIESLEVNRVMPYLLFMVWNSSISDTGVYDVISRRLASIRSFYAVLVILWTGAVCLTYCIDAVNAMLLLTPFAIRIIEEFESDPKKVLISMVVLSNIAATFSDDGSIFNEKLAQSSLLADTSLQEIIWVSGVISFVVTIPYFLIVIYGWRPFEYVGPYFIRKVLFHELDLWRKLDEIIKPGSGFSFNFQLMIGSERHSLKNDADDAIANYSLSISDRVSAFWVPFTQIRDFWLLIRLICIMVAYIVTTYWKLFENKASKSIFFIFLIALSSWDITFQKLMKRIQITTIIMTVSFLFIGNVLVDPLQFTKVAIDKIKTSTDAKEIGDNMFLVSSLSTALFGVGAAQPIVQIIEKLKAEYISQSNKDKITNGMVWASTFGANIAGSATVLGTATAYATSVAATQQGYHLGALRYLIVALPVTILNAVCCYVAQVYLTV